jgi:hypothetical protein
MDNLLTTCYPCNSSKANWTLEELDWELKEIEDGWDGLTDLFMKMMEAHHIETPSLKNYQRMLRKRQR